MLYACDDACRLEEAFSGCAIDKDSGNRSVRRSPETGTGGCLSDAGVGQFAERMAAGILLHC